MRTRTFGIMVTLVCIWSGAPAHADSVASKNKAGNRLFQQGQYQEAEKAYLDAQSLMPGRPELSYNLGNSLIKQKKYEEALQSLRQAVSKGDQRLQANGWYNVGNALYDKGDFKNSAQAYIQSLRINPADKDTKHNLELALKRMQEQNRQQNNAQGQSQNSDRQNPEGNQNRDKNNQEKPQDNQSAQSHGRDEQKQASPTASSVRGFSKERALQILDALKNQELADQRKAAEHLQRKKALGRDW